MKKLFFVVSLLILLVACGEEELPPSPPPPGGDVSAGLAMAGIPIPAGKLPAWSTGMKNTDITPTVVKAGDTVTITIDNVDYAFATIYVLNKFNLWEKVYADSALSGKITKDWAKDKAVFKVKVFSEKLKEGSVYVISYGCDDTGNRNDNGYKVWDCNGKTNKWGLGSFNVESSNVVYPELIQLPIENNDYLSASKSTVPDGVLFTANYKHKFSGVKTDVSVLELSNVASFKGMLKSQLAVLEPLWNLRSPQICGFLKPDAVNKITEYSWMSTYNNKNYWVTVKTFTSVLDDAKVTAYAKYRYATDCNLLNELKQAAIPYCGNGVKDGNDQCDMKDDAACPGACRPDCFCMKTAPQGTCGDCAVNPGEQCEPAGIINPVTGQIESGSSCWVRNLDGSLTEGHCGTNCMCQPGKKVFPQCGNGLCDAGETPQSCPKDCCGVQAPVGCIDSDDENYYYKGTVNKNGVVSNDVCSGNTLQEMVCAGNGVVNVQCPNGCQDGMCKPALAPTSCPDAISVWSHEDKVNGRNIWFSAYWDVPTVWAVKSAWKKPADIVTGEAQSLALLGGADNDPDIATWSNVDWCGNAIVVWSNVPGVEVNADIRVDVGQVAVGADAIDAGVVAVGAGAGLVAGAGGAANVPNIMYSIWSDASGWTAPLQVPNAKGYDPAVDVDNNGVAVAVWAASDGLYASKYNPLAQILWTPPVKVYSANDVSLPQITYNYVTQKWIASWVSGGKAWVAEYINNNWVLPPVQMPGSAVGGALTLPGNRIHIDSQWAGNLNAISYYDNANTVHWQLFDSPQAIQFGGIVPNIFSPDVDHDFYWDNFHVIGKNNNAEFFFDGGANVAAQAASTVYTDGRPAHTYVRITNNDVAVWHSETEQNPYLTDVYWSRRTANGWTPAARLVKTGVPGRDLNTDIAPLFSITSEGKTYFESTTRTTPKPSAGGAWNPPGIQPSNPGMGNPPGGNPPPDGGGGGGGPGVGGGIGGGNGGGSGGDNGGAGGESGLTWTLTDFNCWDCDACTYLQEPAGPCEFAGASCGFGETRLFNMYQFKLMTCGSIQPVGFAWQKSPVRCFGSGCADLAPCSIGISSGNSCSSPNALCYDENSKSGDIFNPSYYLYSCEPVFQALSTGPTQPDSVLSGSYNLPVNNPSFFTGNAVSLESPQSDSSVNLGLFIITVFGILFVTLINFVHHE